MVDTQVEDGEATIEVEVVDPLALKTETGTGVDRASGMPMTQEMTAIGIISGEKTTAGTEVARLAGEMARQYDRNQESSTSIRELRVLRRLRQHQARTDVRP